MRLQHQHLVMAVLLLVTALLTGCNEWRAPNDDELVKQRTDYARNSDGPLRILLIWKDDPMFYQGAELAIEQINAAGGVLGRPLQGVQIVEAGAPNDVAAQVKTQIRDTSIFAAIGYTNSRLATVASVIYERQKVLFIATNATARKLTSYGFDMVFRIIPDNSQMTDQLVKFAVQANWHQIAIIHTRDVYGAELADLFKKNAIDTADVAIPFQKSFFHNREDLREIVAMLKPLPLDAVFFGGIDQDGGRLLQQMAEMNVRLPVLGSDGMDSSEVVNIAGIEASNGMIVPTPFHPAMPLAAKFIEAFVKRYEKPPTSAAALAYDAVQLLAHGATIGKSAVPVVLSVSLRYMDPWQGVTGTHQFDKKGNIFNKDIHFKVLRGGLFYFIPE